MSLFRETLQFCSVLMNENVGHFLNAASLKVAKIREDNFKTSKTF